MPNRGSRSNRLVRSCGDFEQLIIGRFCHLETAIYRLPVIGRRNGIYWKDQKDDLDGVTIPTP